MPTNHPRRWIAALAAAACAVLAPGAAAARSISLPTLTLPIPAPGHATAELFTIKVSGPGVNDNSGVYEATTPDRRSLPKSVRVFSAVRAIPTGSSRTYAFYVLAVNKRSGHAASAAAAAPAAASLVKFRSYPVTNQIHALVMRFTKATKAGGARVAHGHAVGHAIYCDSCTGDATADAVVNVDAATPAAVAPLGQQLKTFFSDNGATASAFSHASLARYDNGHAFKAKVKGARAALRGVADDLIAQTAGDVLKTVARALGTSIG